MRETICIFHREIYVEIYIDLRDFETFFRSGTQMIEIGFSLRNNTRLGFW